MPTTNPRTHITHTPQVVHALDVARARWPEEGRESALILRLLEEGAKAIEESDAYAEERRNARIRALAGAHSDSYGAGYLEEVRGGWPE
ncbi:hypothetical protein J2Y69_002106 [Microbacterium resistens]|uniref:CopG family transcriptional regulator n=1 Tax=Microbacterium resistens TaxID=156977 RepID=A0ABU1SEZ5_9MICO|nr:hypothetical protein [Microbacterium resistens]MDR6867503.1 hypothetical protein [Microbacterium resistens]